MEVIFDLHSELVGKICKLTEHGLAMEQEYKELFGIGNYESARRLFYYCYESGKNELSLMFVKEKPIKQNGCIWYCMKEIGRGSTGDYYWFTLNQVMICSEIKP